MMTTNIIITYGRKHPPESPAVEEVNQRRHQYREKGSKYYRHQNRPAVMQYNYKQNEE